MSTDFTDRPHPFPDRPPPAKSNNALLIVLAVLGGVVVLCAGGALILVVCITAIATIGSNANGTFSYVATKVSSSGTSGGGPETVADLFFQEIDALRWEDAYRRTSAGFQRKYTDTAFHNMILAHPTLGITGPREVQSRNIGPTSATINYLFKGGPTPPMNVEVKLVTESGAWKIDEMDLKPAAAAP